MASLQFLCFTSATVLAPDNEFSAYEMIAQSQSITFCTVLFSWRDGEKGQ